MFLHTNMVDSRNSGGRRIGASPQKSSSIQLDSPEVLRASGEFRIASAVSFAIIPDGNYAIFTQCNSAVALQFGMTPADLNMFAAPLKLVGRNTAGGLTQRRI